MRKTIRSSMLALVTLTLVAALSAPLAAAQGSVTLSATIEKPDLITPEVGAKEFDITFDYQLPNAGFNVGANYQSYVPVDVNHDCGNGINVEGPNPVIVPLDFQQTTTGSSTHSRTETYYVSATKDAQGMTNIRCTLTAQAQAINNPGIPQSNQLSRDYFITVDYYDSLSVNINNPIQRAAPQREISFTLSISNFGNADTRLLFSIAEDGAPNEERYDWNYVLPTSQIVPSAFGGANNVLDTTFTVSTPARTGWNNVLDGYTIVISPQAEVDSSALGTPISAQLLVRVRGVYVPGFEVVGLLGGLLGAMVAIRRRGLE